MLRLYTTGTVEDLPVYLLSHVADPRAWMGNMPRYTYTSYLHIFSLDIHIKHLVPLS